VDAGGGFGNGRKRERGSPGISSSINQCHFLLRPSSRSTRVTLFDPGIDSFVVVELLERVSRWFVFFLWFNNVYSGSDLGFVVVVVVVIVVIVTATSYHPLLPSDE
jgi:hypothetical protein